MAASRALLLVPLVSVLTTGCGSSSHKQAEPSRLTQQQFVSAANAECIKSDRRVFRLARLSLLPAGWAAMAAEARTALAEMSVLRPPARAELGFRHLLSLGRELASGIEHVHEALMLKNYKVAQAAELRATKAETAIHEQAKQLGLTFCQQLQTNWPA